MTNSFVWPDLSTFDIDAAMTFYNQCFGWGYRKSVNDYSIAEINSKAAAGIFTMPEKFQRIGMPSFWMSYIRVADIEQTVRVAAEHGATVEIQPQPAPGGGLIALIRDPAGAGFTCYEGDDPGGRADDPGHMVWNELHISDLGKVDTFYTSVFGWVVRPSSDNDRFLIFRSQHDAQAIAGIQVLNNNVKGEKEYWGVYFSVESLAETSMHIVQGGGKIVAEQPLGAQPALLAYDPQGAAFYVAERASNHQQNRATVVTPKVKWRAILGLLLVALAVLSEFNWVWGLLFLLWVIPDIRQGSTHFLEHVERRKNPIVYWLIISVWAGLSLYLLLENIVGV